MTTAHPLDLTERGSECDPQPVAVIATVIVMMFIAPRALVVPMPVPVAIVHIAIVIEPNAKFVGVLVAGVRAPAIAGAIADDMCRCRRGSDGQAADADQCGDRAVRHEFAKSCHVSCSVRWTNALVCQRAGVNIVASPGK